MNRAWLVCALVGLASGASGNDGAFDGVGGTVYPLKEHPSIQLVAEDIRARVSIIENVVDVTCLFVLTNHDDSDTVTIGFPEIASQEKPDPFIYFRSYVDGQEVECTRIEDPNAKEFGSRNWWMKTVDFPAGATRIIRNEYRAYTGFNVGDGCPRRSFWYVVNTGASWAGPICAGTITITIEPCDDRLSSPNIWPEPSERRGCDYVWRFRDYEPGPEDDSPGLGWCDPRGWTSPEYEYLFPDGVPEQLLPDKDRMKKGK